MNITLTTAQRIVVAADFEPLPDCISAESVKRQVMNFAQKLSGTGICFKMNSGLRGNGYSCINAVHKLGLSFFADLKLVDIDATLRTDGKILRSYRPELLTVMCNAAPRAINAICNELPETQILGVTVPTSFTEEDAQRIYQTSIRDAVLRLVEITVEKTPVRSFVCSPAEATLIHEKFGPEIVLITPAIRPAWSVVAQDDQNADRVMTPEKAIIAGATRIVIGRPFTQANIPREAVEKTIAEVSSALLKKTSRKTASLSA